MFGIPFVGVGGVGLMSGLGLFGITEAALMFALGFGYIICYLAKKEDKGLRGLGHMIGMAIIVLSSLLILINIYTRLITRVCSSMAGSVAMPSPGFKSGMMHQPMMPPAVKK